MLPIPTAPLQTTQPAIAVGLALALLFAATGCAKRERELEAKMEAERQAAAVAAALEAEREAREAEEQAAREEERRMEALRKLDGQIAALESKREALESERARLEPRILALQKEIADCTRASQALGQLANGRVNVRDRGFLMDFLGVWFADHVHPAGRSREAAIQRLMSGETAACLATSRQLDRRVSEVSEQANALQEPWKAVTGQLKDCNAQLDALHLERLAADRPAGGEPAAADGRSESVPETISKTPNPGESE